MPDPLELVVDTNVVVAALRSPDGASRQVIRRVLQGRWRVLLGNALWSEYEDVMARSDWPDTPTLAQRRTVLAAIAANGRWVPIYYGWRPNLRDEGDNHLIELAIAGGASTIVSHNWRDLTLGQLRWPQLAVLTPSQCLERYPESLP